MSIIRDIKDIINEMRYNATKVNSNKGVVIDLKPFMSSTLQKYTFISQDKSYCHNKIDVESLGEYQVKKDLELKILGKTDTLGTEDIEYKPVLLKAGDIIYFMYEPKRKINIKVSNTRLNCIIAYDEDNEEIGIVGLFNYFGELTLSGKIFVDGIYKKIFIIKKYEKTYDLYGSIVKDKRIINKRYFRRPLDPEILEQQNEEPEEENTEEEINDYASEIKVPENPYSIENFSMDD